MHFPEPHRFFSTLLYSILILFSVGNVHAQQTGTVGGTVTRAATGEPLPGVNVLIEGTQGVEEIQKGASTGAQGKFVITDVPAGTYALRASFIGYADKTKEGIEVTAGEATTVDIAMGRKSLGLDEVVVVGYGQQQREDLTGSISSVSGEGLEEVPTPTLEGRLKGRVPGLSITQSASPEGGARIRIRGSNSLLGNNSPLIVVDGFPLPEDEQANSSMGSRQQGGSAFAGINPDNIKSVEVLKGASATAIYGSRGANGVLLITTKSGRYQEEGEMRVNFSAEANASVLPGYQKVLTGEQYAKLRN